MSYTIYNTTTGQIVSSAQVQETEPPFVSDEQSSIPIFYQGQYFYIDTATQQAVRIPRPPADGSVYVFDYATKTYQIDLDATAIQARKSRNLGLGLVDQVNPLWFASLTTEQQQQLQDYRLALLAVPQQQGFPATIAWPTRPSWL